MGRDTLWHTFQPPLPKQNEIMTSTPKNSMQLFGLYGTGGCLWQDPLKPSLSMDHTNLQYWREPHKVPQRIACEMMELEEYNFKLVHIKGRENGRADTLSRWPS